MALWFVLAIVVFNVTFDWEVRAAAGRSAVWLVAIAVAGTAAVAAAGRGQVR